MKAFHALLLFTALQAVLFATAIKLQRDNTACRLITFIPFSDLRPGLDDEEESYGYGSWPSAESLGKAGFSLMASAEMARRHFNQKDTSIVPELADLIDCPISLPANSLYQDSGFSRDQTVDTFLKREFEDVQKGVNPATQVCAIIGPVETEAHDGLSALTENFDIPQLAYASIQHRLSRTDLFPRFVRLIPDATDWGETLAKAVNRDLWQRNYLAIIYEPDYGDDFESPLEDAEDDLPNFLTITEEVDELEGDDSIEDALNEVVKEGYRTIMYIGDRFTLLDDIARVADGMGLLGEGYFWIISGAALQPAMLPTVRAQVGSPLDKLLNGAAMFTNYDPFVYNATSDKFLEAWKNQNEQLIAELNAKSPKPQGDEEGVAGNIVSDASFYTAESDYFETEVPTEYASFIYDAVVAAGIGACRAFVQDGENGQHYESILQSSFTGASGNVRFKNNDDGEPENSRDMTDVTFGIHNIRPTETDASGQRGYESILFATWNEENEHINPQGEVESGAWKVLDGVDFLYFGQTSDEPTPLRTVANANYIPTSTQRIGFALVGLSCFLSLASGGWVLVNRKEKIVTAGQPPFLYILCFGSILVAISLIFISFDEDKGFSKTQLDRGCSVFPWLFMFGYLTIYCSLLCKLWRLSKLMQLRRRKVTIHQVLAPFGIIMLCTLLVLLIWQLNDPLVWVRTVVNLDPLETYGECRVEGNLLAYLIPLGFLIVLVTVGTAVYAWKLKDVQSDLSESKWIFFGIFTHLQTWAVGIPIVVITDDTSREAGYMMFVALTFVFSTTMVGFVIWPKIFVWFRSKYMKGPNRKEVTISTSGTGNTRVSGLYEPGAINPQVYSSQGSQPSFNPHGSSKEASMEQLGVEAPKEPAANDSEQTRLAPKANTDHNTEADANRSTEGETEAFTQEP